MITDRQAICDAFEALVQGQATDSLREFDASGWSASLWRSVHDNGFSAVAVAQEYGGAGASLEDLAAILQLAGYHAAPIPLAEANLAAIALAQAGCPVSGGARVFVPQLVGHPVTIFGHADDRRLSGSLRRIPWASHSDEIVLLVDMQQAPGSAPVRGLSTVATAHCSLVSAFNIAGEPLADITLPSEGVPIKKFSAPTSVDIPGHWTLARVSLMVGSMRRILELSVHHAGARQQFGRPISAFQAIQHELARLASAIEQADAMAKLALSVASGEGAELAILAAKICAGQAAAVAIQVGHQVHGAVGLTLEYELQRHTRRLMAWRDEGGTEMHSARELGYRISQLGKGRLWDLIATSNEPQHSATEIPS